MKLSTFVAALAVNMIVIPVAIALEPSLPAYQATSGLSGQIKSVGSDTLGNEVALWAKAFKELYPDVKIDVEAKGSLTAPPALLAGVSQFGPMSIPMTAEEVDAFEKKYGYRPSSFRVAVDALAIYVNKDNPISCLTRNKWTGFSPRPERAAAAGALTPGGMLARPAIGPQSRSRCTAVIQSRELTSFSETWCCTK
jgi:phosphate transport system substrate-binding protein